MEAFYNKAEPYEELADARGSFLDKVVPSEVSESHLLIAIGPVAIICLYSHASGFGSLLFGQ